MAPRLAILRPGPLDYANAYELQQRVATDVRSGGDPTLILLEHPPTYTLGARANRLHVITSDERLLNLGAEVISTDRGGDVTFHGPGQVVGYPILDLRTLGIGVSDYVCRLEQVLIDVLAQFGISAGRSSRNRGVWVGEEKIAAIGVRVSRGVTTHGFALNVNTDLSWFDHIVPCGMPDVRMTSMQEAWGETVLQSEVEDSIVDAFLSHFEMRAAELAEVHA